MSILRLAVCAARKVTGGPGCVGPVDAVRCVVVAGDKTGCVLHAAKLREYLPGVRFYPGSVEGAALAAYFLAGQTTQCGVDELAGRARELLARYGRVEVEREPVRRYVCGFCHKVRVLHPADNCVPCGRRQRKAVS